MAAIARFEDIEAWKLAREATNQIYLITSTGAFAKDFALRDQIRKAIVSTMSKNSDLRGSKFARG